MAQHPVEPNAAISSLFNAKPTVVIGNRAYLATGWTRKDTIWFRGQKIGQIVLAHNDRPGTTVALNGRRQAGRAIDWCLHQFLISSQRERRQAYSLAA
jgi:hypothetical protein